MPTATTSLTLATQKPFGTLTCDFWQGNDNEFYMTRDQVGAALEYTKQNEAIAQIHSRNADRLNPLSTLLKTKRVEHSVNYRQADDSCGRKDESKMTTSLTLATQKPFGTLTCDFYKNDANEFYMTREQIGRALEYAKKPGDAIEKIHERNPDRLNPLSVTVKLTGTDGKMYNTFVYTLRGVMEICRFSRQPKADKFMDFVWDVMESLYNGNSVLAAPDRQTAVMPETHRTASNTLGINFLILSQALLAPKVHNQCRFRCVIITQPAI